MTCSNMNMFELTFFSLYLILACVSWPVLTFFLHDEKKELHGSWTLSIVYGMLSAVLWPVSLFALISKRSNEDDKET